MLWYDDKLYLDITFLVLMTTLRATQYTFALQPFTLTFAQCIYVQHCIKHHIHTWHAEAPLRMGIKLLIFWFVDDLLYYLSHSRPNAVPSYRCQEGTFLTV